MLVIKENSNKSLYPWKVFKNLWVDCVCSGTTYENLLYLIISYHKIKHLWFSSHKWWTGCFPPPSKYAGLLSGKHFLYEILLVCTCNGLADEAMKDYTISWCSNLSARCILFSRHYFCLIWLVAKFGTHSFLSLNFIGSSREADCPLLFLTEFCRLRYFLFQWVLINESLPCFL